MEVVTKRKFEKDVKRLVKQGKDFTKLECVLDALLKGEVLPAKYKNHKLSGNWRPCWELHIEPDWLLIYFIDPERDVMTLYRTGSHSDLF